jgi:large subunit ribosomal protein L4
VLDGLSMDAPKTSAIAGMLKAMGLEGKSTLITTAEHAPMVYKSARNVQRVEVLPVSDLNALAILKPHRVLVTKEAMDQLKEKTSSATAEAKG